MSEQAGRGERVETLLVTEDLKGPLPMGHDQLPTTTGEPRAHRLENLKLVRTEWGQRRCADTEDPAPCLAKLNPVDATTQTRTSEGGRQLHGGRPCDQRHPLTTGGTRAGAPRPRSWRLFEWCAWSVPGLNSALSRYGSTPPPLATARRVSCLAVACMRSEESDDS